MTQKNEVRSKKKYHFLATWVDIVSSNATAFVHF